MWRSITGVLGCVLFVLPAAYAQPDAEPGMAGRDPAVAVPAPLELGTAFEAINRLNNPAEKIDLSSPEATVRSFIWAFNNNDLAQARLCVLNAAPVEKLKPLQDLLGNQMGRYAALSLKDLHVYSREREAIVTFWLDFVTHIKLPNFQGSSERLRLQQVNGTWLIAPRQDPKIPFWQVPPPVIEDLMDLFIAKMVDTETMQDELTLSQCQTNLKQIGLGIFQYAMDNNQFFPSAQGWQKLLQPYVRNEAIYHCTAAAHDVASYTFNSEIENLGLSDVETVTQTILMYEGKDRKFEFRHKTGEEKLTNIVFADGHVKAFSEQELAEALVKKTVRWDP